MTKEKILVVDDEPHVLDLIKIRLESQEYEVIPASAGEEALAHARDVVLDLAIMDLKLGPGEDGLGVMEKLDKEGKKITIAGTEYDLSDEAAAAEVAEGDEVEATVEGTTVQSLTKAAAPAEGEEAAPACPYISL
ncbi:MAG: hypothetical protein A3G93_05600 [Nitrospinae bacterium RIFCSPLOWO2_12_FULL_45_22]|nr:MAG: hypothetical protein A3G93_05600 [Nitrospinae bacterium RIFCSPLOWO2_12_FULL_45_22]